MSLINIFGKTNGEINEETKRNLIITYLKNNDYYISFVNFSNITFFNITFFNINFSECIFRDSLFKNSNFIKCNFDGCSIARCNFSNTKFKDCSFEFTDLLSSNFCGANLLNSKSFSKADLIRVMYSRKTIFPENLDPTKRRLILFNFDKERVCNKK